MTRLLIADDHPLFREALHGALAKYFSDLVIEEADTLESTLTKLEKSDDYDLILLDLHMPGAGDLYGLIRIRNDYPLLPIAVISGTEDAQVISRCMGFGALGFIPKSLASVDIAKAISCMLEGEEWVPADVREQIADISQADLELAEKVAALTPQQYKVLFHVHEGLLNKQIAYELGITEATVKAHMTAIFRKLDVYSRTQVVLLAERLQLAPPSS
ncbi:MAG: two component signal transduction system LuxR family response reguator [Idiomarinaceae bacterium HL-53]|nr:MAG: two component signal transduction system LuxR family response reguator [Idiomarinaceae bacterium HL-53]CUS47235.1 two component transcriptional regulator, LuxR family [Idiomarinaceae bacterium HL-53]